MYEDEKQPQAVKVVNDKIGAIEFDLNKAKPFPDKNKVCLIIMHHTASEGQTVEQIDREHKRLGWACIGYHFYIRKDGSVYRGRPAYLIG